MFNDDEVRSSLSKMYECSPVDGFVEISEGLGKMIKSLANEPSVGLFYVQQHTHKAVPNLVSLRNNVVAKSRDISLHTEDTEDSITMVRSMKECGFPIVDDMLKDITKSLAIMSSKQPKKGLISSRSVSGSWGPAWGSTYDVERSSNYLSSVLKSAKEKATTLKWTQVDTSDSVEDGKHTDYLESAGGDLSVSSHSSVGQHEKDVSVDDLLSNLSRSENFDEFKADKEARFEEWLRSNDTHDDQHREGTTE
uniref:uncharacterized protein LOC122579655 n=1 Tax=Erigeron canadensis TaxID=72917 RepID=UPI001CB8C519|nr:uncharacterized protein LOC122579655 [Erigeron canadensis]